jgi:hypothetical protein
VAGVAQVLIQPPLQFGHFLGGDVAGRVGDGQVAAGRDGADQPGHDPLRLAEVRDVVQDGQQHDRDRLGEVQGGGGLLDDAVHIPQVGI